MPRPKNSAEYWKWRQAKRMYEQMEQADKVGEDISRIYAQASAQIEGEIERIFFTYQQKWGLSKAEAKRLLKKVRGKNTVDVLKAMLPHVDEAVREEFKAQIESGAYAARIKRLEDLQGNLDKVMRDVYKQDEQRQREHYVQFAEESYNREIYEIQKQVGFQFEFNDISEEAIDMVLNRKWCGESFSDAIWKNTQKVADEVRDVLLLELMTGQRHEDAARALAERMAVGAMQSRRIIRTESNYISGQVQLQAYEECGAEKYMYVATLDSRTDEECGMLDGKTFLVKDAQPGVNFHPMHPNCRCTDIIALDDDTLKNLQRRARDTETGKNELVPAGTTWEEWKNQQFRPIDDYWKREVHRSNDKKQYERYRNLLGTDAPLSFSTFQKIKYENPKHFDEIKKKYYEKRAEKKALEVYDVATINTEIYKAISSGIDTDKVVITQRQLDHIAEKHPESYKSLVKNMKSILEDPLVIYEEGKHPNTGIVVGKIDDEGCSYVVKVHTSEDPKNYFNSVITGWQVGEKAIKRLERNNKILYKKEM